MTNKPSDLYQRLLIVSGFLFLAITAALQLNIFHTTDQLYTFRPDNFWAYSSMIFRRALTGEFLYYLDLITGHGIYLFSVLIWLTFLLFLVAYLSELKKEFNSIGLLLCLLSPVFLLYQVDAEIFMLLPFITLYSKSNFVQNWGTLILIVFSVLIRELSLLFFFPVLVTFILQGRMALKAATITALLLLLVFLFSPKPAPTFYLENNYWNAQGFHTTHSFIGSKHLYDFVSMPLSDLLSLHISLLKEIENGWFLLGLPLISFMGLFAGIFYARTKSVGGTLYSIGLVSVSFILTLDYGRYFYLFFMFALFASSNQVKNISLPFLHCLLYV